MPPLQRPSERRTRQTRQRLGVTRASFVLLKLVACDNSEDRHIPKLVDDRNDSRTRMETLFQHTARTQPEGVPAQGLAAGDRERLRQTTSAAIASWSSTPRAAARGSAAAGLERRPDQRSLRPLLKEGRAHGTGGLSPNTVHHVHVVLHRALRDAVKWGYLQPNVAQFADPPRASAQHWELPVWSEEQLHAFLDSVAPAAPLPPLALPGDDRLSTRRGFRPDLA